ncbi:MAG: hypothetical protein ABSG74_04055 [Candidatus Bathyarchaeia archaeon]
MNKKEGAVRAFRRHTEEGTQKELIHEWLSIADSPYTMNETPIAPSIVKMTLPIIIMIEGLNSRLGALDNIPSTE